MKASPNIKKCQHTNYIVSAIGLECENCGLLKSTVEQVEQVVENPHQEIDPVAQVFIDFNSYLHQPNENGETNLILYQEWANRARNAMDCACHEGWRTEMSHSKYHCKNGEIGILRA